MVAKAASISWLVSALSTWICNPTARAAGSTSRDKTKPDGVFGNDEHDGDRRGCRLGGEHHRGAFDRGDHGDPPANQFGRQRRQPIELSLGPAVFDHQVL